MAGWIVLDLVRGHLSLRGVLLSWRFTAQLSALKMRKQEREGTVRFREREGKGDGRSEKLNNSNRQMEKKRIRSKKSKERIKKKMNKTFSSYETSKECSQFFSVPIFLPPQPALAV